MYLVGKLGFGRISQYYRYCAESGVQAFEDGRSFTLGDLAARWIVRAGVFRAGFDVLNLGCSYEPLRRHLVTATGCRVLSSADVEGRPDAVDLDGVFAVIPAGAVLPAVHQAPWLGRVRPGGFVLLAVDVDFASNDGLDAIVALKEAERTQPAGAAGAVAADAVERSPMLLIRHLLGCFGVSTLPDMSGLSVDRFVLDPDVMTDPVCQHVTDQAKAQEVALAGDIRSHRRGLVLIALVRDIAD